MVAPAAAYSPSLTPAESPAPLATRTLQPLATSRLTPSATSATRDSPIVASLDTARRMLGADMPESHCERCAERRGGDEWPGSAGKLRPRPPGRPSQSRFGLRGATSA